jgi:hypothetical protein
VSKFAPITDVSYEVDSMHHCALKMKTTLILGVIDDAVSTKVTNVCRKVLQVLNLELNFVKSTILWAQTPCSSVCTTFSTLGLLFLVCPSTYSLILDSTASHPGK